MLSEAEGQGWPAALCVTSPGRGLDPCGRGAPAPLGTRALAQLGTCMLRPSPFRYRNLPSPARTSCSSSSPTFTQSGVHLATSPGSAPEAGDLEEQGPLGAGSAQFSGCTHGCPRSSPASVGVGSAGQEAPAPPHQERGQGSATGGGDSVTG